MTLNIPFSNPKGRILSRKSNLRSTISRVYARHDITLYSESARRQYFHILHSLTPRRKSYLLKCFTQKRKIARIKLAPQPVLACKLVGHIGKMRWLTIQFCLSTEESSQALIQEHRIQVFFDGIAWLVLNAANDGRSTQRSMP